MRELPHPPGREVFIQHDKDFASTVYYRGGDPWPIFYLRDVKGGYTHIFNPGFKDWYIVVALEKLNKLTVDRDKITPDIILQYRWAIREGYNHGLDPFLINAYDHPRNKNILSGVLGYIAGMKKKSDAEMELIRNS